MNPFSVQVYLLIPILVALAACESSSAPPASTPTTGSQQISPLLCRPPGPIYPRPTSLATSPLFRSATTNLSSLLDAALNGNIHAGWDGIANTSYSIGVISLKQRGGGDGSSGFSTWDEGDGDGSEVLVWEKHHLSENRAMGPDGEPRGTGVVDRDSQWLVGSLTKVFTDFILVKSGVGMERKIGEFLPELIVGDIGNEEGGEETRIAWGEVTLGMLAGHTSGIVPNFGFSEFYFLKDYFHSLGYPIIPDSDYPKCGVIGLNDDCNKQTLLTGLRTSSHPIAPPSTRPQYSNIAFSLIALALEQATGKNYTALLNEYVIEPFNLTNTMLSPGVDSRAVIPPVMNSWGGGYGINAPGGGLVSSLSDLSTFISAIIGGTAFLTYPFANNHTWEELSTSRTKTRTWLKTPSILTGSPYSAVGAPWEIYRASNLVPEHPHVVDVYGKGGSAYGYQAQIGIVEEYGIGIVVMTAGGGGGACQNVYDAVLGSLVRVVDQVARVEAGDSYVGSFGTVSADAVIGEGGKWGHGELHRRSERGTSPEKRMWGYDEQPGVMWNVTVSQDVHSLILEGLWHNGTDMLESYISIWNATMGAYVPAYPTLARMYPVDINVDGLYTPPGTDTSVEVVREDWRLDWALESSSTKSDLPGTGFGDDGASKDNCLSWTWVDWLYYGGEAMDRIVFVRRKKDGKVVGVEVPYLRSGVLEKL